MGRTNEAGFRGIGSQRFVGLLCIYWRSKRLPSAVLLSLVALALVLLPKGAEAQTYLNQTGQPTFTTAQPVTLGFANIANGNMRIGVPLGSYPQRKGPPFSAGLVYDSRIWQGITGSWQPTNVPNSQGGWRFITNVSPGTVVHGSKAFTCRLFPSGFGTWILYKSFQWIAPDGTTHHFNIATTPGSSQCGVDPISSGANYAEDSSGYFMSVTNYTVATVKAPDGTQVFPSRGDTNGNYFYADASGNVFDMLGRTPVTATSNCTGNANLVCYDVLNSQGGTSRFIVTLESIPVSTAFGQSGVTEYSGNITVIQKPSASGWHNLPVQLRFRNHSGPLRGTDRRHAADRRSGQLWIHGIF
jgi:hypothetical protein